MPRIPNVIATFIAAAIAIAIASAAPPANARSRTVGTDVLVIGGTPAGVAAALAAARGGASVTLASATHDLGGVLTDAMMDQWDLNAGPDGTIVERGIFLDLYARLGDVFMPTDAARELARAVAAQPRIVVQYDLALDGVETAATAAGRRVTSVRMRDVATDAETVFVPASVVDATDSGDLAAAAGARYDVGRQDSGIDEREQAITPMFSVANVDWGAVLRAYDVSRDGAGGAAGARAWGYSKLAAGYVPSAADVLVRDLNLGRMADGTVTVNAIDICGVEGLDPAAVRIAAARGEREAYRLVEYLRARLPGFERARVAGFARAPYVRETRHIAGLERLTSTDVWSGRIPSDTIGLSSYPLDLHPVDPRDGQAFAPERHVYGIPFGALVPRGLENVALASPAISASHAASGSARIVPTTIEEGEAAGVAADLALVDRTSLAALAQTPRLVQSLREELVDRGAIVALPPAVVAMRREGRS